MHVEKSFVDYLKNLVILDLITVSGKGFYKNDHDGKREK